MTTFKRYTYNGVTVQASARRSSSRTDKAWERTVRTDGREVTVHYADPDMPMRRTNDDARANFLSRHNCDGKRDPTAPGFWSCYDWANPAEKAMGSASAVMVVKATGKRRMFLVSSNPYRDREADIVKEAALQDYVRTFDGNDLKFWHTGHPIGRIVSAEMVGPFLVEEAVEADNRVIITRTPDGRGMRVTTIKTVWDELEADPGRYDAASIGFRYRLGDKGQDRAFRRIYKHETSVLPHVAAANAYTYAEVVNNE